MRSILDYLDSRVDQNPNQVLYAFLDDRGDICESLTYQQFNLRANDIASHLARSCPLAPGDRVLLAYPPGLDIICAFFACVRMGLIPVPVYPPAPQAFGSALYKMTFIAKDCGAKAILTDRRLYWSMKLNLKRHSLQKLSFKPSYISRLPWIISSDADSSGKQNYSKAHSDILFLQYTSGSTSDPKGVMVSHDNIIHNCDIVVDHDPVGVSWLPQYHDMGLIGYYLFFALKGGTTYGMSPLDFIRKPYLWLNAISRYRATASSAPNFAYEYCLRADRYPQPMLDNLDLSSLQFLMTAAEPVTVNTFIRFREKFKAYGLRPDCYFSAYGLAEFTLAVTNYGRQVNRFESTSLAVGRIQPLAAGAADIPAAAMLSCGVALGDTEIEIADISGPPVKAEPGRVGEIWVRGKSKCLGYWQREELSQGAFQATFSDTRDSKTWLRTGDLGFIHQNELYICGRIKDLIIIRGLNYYPQDIEAITQKDPAIRPGAVAAFSVAAFSGDEQGAEQLVVIAEIKNPKRIPSASDISHNILQCLGVAPDLIAFVPPATIPKTSSGKIIRHQAKSLFLSQKLNILAEQRFHPHRPTGELEHLCAVAGDGQHKDQLAALFQRYGLESSLQANLEELQFDSLKLAEIAHEIRQLLESKGHDDLSQAIDTSLLPKIAVSELFSILHGLLTHKSHSKLQFRMAFSSLQKEHRKLEREMMLRDLTLFSPAGMDAESLPPNTDSGGIFITGGSGFFGPFLLKSLLEQTRDQLYVLIRADSPAAALAKLRHSFALAGHDQSMQQQFDSRVKPICGDLAQSKFGLSAEQWQFIAENTHTIYHNGAQVNYLLDYESLRRANVLGSNEIVRLATCARPKTVNHISTTFIFGWATKDVLFESDSNDNIELLDFGYSQSKWVAEALIKQAMDSGLKARIFRPALISPSIDGNGYNFDISIRLIAFMLKYGIGTEAENQVSFTPADIAANNIVAIANIEDSLNRVFHVTRSEYSSMNDVTRLLGSLTGKRFSNFKLKQFVPEVVSRCDKSDILFPLLNFLVRSVDNISAMEFKRYDNSNYRNYCAQSSWGRSDPPLADVVKGILKFMQNQGIAD